jgi:hypothetical protein
MNKCECKCECNQESETRLCVGYDGLNSEIDLVLCFDCYDNHVSEELRAAFETWQIQPEPEGWL